MPLVVNAPIIIYIFKSDIGSQCSRLQNQPPFCTPSMSNYHDRLVKKHKAVTQSFMRNDGVVTTLNAMVVNFRLIGRKMYPFQAERDSVLCCQQYTILSVFCTRSTLHSGHTRGTSCKTANLADLVTTQCNKGKFVYSTLSWPHECPKCFTLYSRADLQSSISHAEFT